MKHSADVEHHGRYGRTEFSGRAAVRGFAAWLFSGLLLSSCSSAPDLTARQEIAEPEPIEAGAAPPSGPYAPGFDALHYDVEIRLPAAGSFIEGRMAGRFLLEEPIPDTLALDLTGLAVHRVEVNTSPSSYRYAGGKVHVPVPPGARRGDTLDVAIVYAGRPDDGLIIGRNVHGRPSAFADNWPNRARFWFPSIDHPSDKATVRFVVHDDPDADRKVIANGRLEGPDDQHVWRWSTTRPIPTYTMVVGAAEFEVDTVGVACQETDCVPVTTWLFPPDVDRGARSFRRAAEMVEYYNDLVAPFPYEKLAHVQASTRFGGMENVTAVFYPEDVIHDGVDIEQTVAHETAHQWFGDAVTEADWRHLWLSEGFAEYFGALYFEHADGPEAFREIMKASLSGYLRSGAWTEPIVTDGVDSLFELLNANNYDKAAWVLHMLRRQLGDVAFFDGIRAYYRAHEHGTALTEDLRRALEAASGRSLEVFFDQWLYQPGHPQLAVEWTQDRGELAVVIRQMQPASWPIFTFPLDLLVETEEGPVRRTVDVDQRRESLRLDLPGDAMRLTIDPEGDLLHEVVSATEVPAR